MTYKYQSYIDALLLEGCAMPELYMPDGKESYRFIFLNDETRNHLPVCIMNPKRQLPGSQKLAGYSLSCFADGDKAEEKYRTLQRSFKLISTAIGDGLAKGNLCNEDGAITKENEQTSHFELFEYTTCNLNKTFTLEKKLI